MNCDTCGKEMPSSEAVILWSESPRGTVNELQIVHRAKCDDGRLMSSGGAAYGNDWSPEDASETFADKAFAKAADRVRLESLLIAHGQHLKG